MPKCSRAGTFDAGEDVLALPDGGVIDAHAGIVDGRMHDAVGVGLRRPDVVVDRLRIRLARGVELEDGDDLARLRLLDQIVIVKAPVRGDVGAEAAAGVAGAAARPRPDVEDAHFQDVAGLGAFDRDRTGEEMHADPLACAADERAFDRAGAAARHRLVLARPLEHALGAGIALDHALVIVVGMMGQRLDGGAVAGAQRQGRRDLLGEIAPVDGLRRNRQREMLHEVASSGNAVLNLAAAALIAPPPESCRLPSR